MSKSPLTNGVGVVAKCVKDKVDSLSSALSVITAEDSHVSDDGTVIVARIGLSGVGETAIATTPDPPREAQHSLLVNIGMASKHFLDGLSESAIPRRRVYLAAKQLECLRRRGRRGYLASLSCLPCWTNVVEGLVGYREAFDLGS